MAEARTEHCMICGEPLEYLQAAEQVTCSSCGSTWQGHVKCPKGHVLCDACHGAEARRIITQITLGSESKDPMEVAERMMAHPALPMLSCDHSYIAAGALLAALRNSPYGKVGEQEVAEAFGRIAKQAHGGFCGLTGVCGIVPAVGAVLSVFLGTHCGADREQRIVMDAVTRVSRAITALTGPSCCKAYVRAGIVVAADVFSETLGIVLPIQRKESVCQHVSRHPHGCRKERCPYYRKPSKDIFAESGFTPGMIGCVT